MSKTAKFPAIACFALSFCGCVSSEGRYSPDCIAFAGDTIELADGRFEWDKFTDQVRMDDNGKVTIDNRPVHTYTLSNDIAYIEPQARVY